MARHSQKMYMECSIDSKISIWGDPWFILDIILKKGDKSTMSTFANPTIGYSELYGLRLARSRSRNSYEISLHPNSICLMSNFSGYRKVDSGNRERKILVINPFINYFFSSCFKIPLECFRVVHS